MNNLQKDSLMGNFSMVINVYVIISIVLLTVLDQLYLPLNKSSMIDSTTNDDISDEVLESESPMDGFLLASDEDSVIKEPRLLSSDENDSRAPTASVTVTILNMLKSYLGSGILGLPFAFRQSGLAGGIIILIVVSLSATHSMLFLTKCKRAVAKHGAVTFADIGTFVFGSWMGGLINTLLVFTQFGFCVVYMVFVSENFGRLFPDSSPTYGRLYVLLAWFPIFVALSWIRTLKLLAPVSLLANISILFGLCTVMAAAHFQINTPSIYDEVIVDKGFVWSTLPITFGVAVYAFEGIGLVIPSETAMKRPEKFPMVIVLVMLISTINYVTFATVCYSAFGRDTHDHIIENVRAYASSSHTSAVWSKLELMLRFAWLFAIAATFPSQLFVVTDIIEHTVLRPGLFACSFYNKWWKQNGIRTFLVLVCTICAILLPKFGLLMGLIGAVGGANLQFVFPCLFYLRLYPKRPIYETIFCWCYIIFGVLGCVSGLTVTIMHLLKELN